MLDISNICRICLKEEDPKLPIFTENDDRSESKPTLPEKIMSFARVKVVKDDGLPMYICVKCYCQVDTTVEFKRLCEESFHFFTQQLDSFTNRRSNPTSHSSHGNARAADVSKNPDRPQWVVPEESVKTEDCDAEYSQEGESTSQVFRITGSDDAWAESEERVLSEAEMEPQMIKCEPIWDYPGFEFDLSDLKIENGGEGSAEDSGVNPLEISSDENRRRDGSPFDDMFTPTSSIERTCKCRSCEMVFSNRREMGFHISVAHRRCGTCGKYFFSNKDKDGHICSETDLEEKSYAPNRTERTGQCCHLCNKTVKQMRSHMAWHRKRKMKLSEGSRDGNAGDVADPSSAPLESYTVLEGDRENVSGNRIKCHLCDAVCLNQKGFKIHITCMHRDHRIVYVCLVCKTHQFFGRANYKRHMLQEHGLLASGNIQFELKHVTQCEVDDVKGVLKRKIRKKAKMFNPVKVDRRVRKLKVNSAECHDLTDGDGSGAPRAPSRANGGRRSEPGARRSNPRPSHPPFTTEIPIISNNFEVTHDPTGVKVYICRGCNVHYKRYISAYHHYYTITKRAAKLEQNQLVIEGKFYNCKFCTLKFSSRSQAMMHRIHAHKYFHKKIKIDKKSKSRVDVEDID